MRKLFNLILILCLFGCAKKVVVRHPHDISGYSDSGKYEYVETSPHTYIVFVESGDQKEAEKIIGCHICATKYLGKVWQIEKK